jgi:hypothetical protein
MTDSKFLTIHEHHVQTDHDGQVVTETTIELQL